MSNQSLFDRTGFILYTIRYSACVTFYRDVLELPIHFATDTLTCFAFGSSYLMVEEDDEFSGPLPTVERTRTCLRMNVEDVVQFADKLSKKGIEVDLQIHDWGSVAKFRDPDGNLCAFKDSEKFEQQMANGQ